MAGRKAERGGEVNSKVNFIAREGAVTAGSLTWFGVNAARLNGVEREKIGTQE